MDEFLSISKALGDETRVRAVPVTRGACGRCAARISRSCRSATKREGSAVEVPVLIGLVNVALFFRQRFFKARIIEQRAALGEDRGLAGRYET